MESISKRNALVDQLVAKLKTEYKSELDNLLLSIHIFDPEIPVNHDEFIATIAFRASLLTWVRQQLIETNGSMFRAASYVDNDNQKAIFWVDNQTLEILLEKPKLILDIGSHFRFDFRNLPQMFKLDKTNFHNIVSIFERVAFLRAKETS